MRKIMMLGIISMLLFAGEAFAADAKSRCPDKVFETNTLEGVYDGVDCGERCYASVKLANGESFSFLCGEEEAEKTFGKAPGNRVSVTYDVRQFWQPEDGPEGGFCFRGEVFKSGKILEVAKNSAANKPPAQQSSTPASSGREAPAMTLQEFKDKARKFSDANSYNSLLFLCNETLKKHVGSDKEYKIFVLYTRGENYLSSHDTENANNDADAILDLDKNSLLASILKSLIFIEKKNYTEAIKWVERWRDLSIDPERKKKVENLLADLKKEQAETDPDTIKRAAEERERQRIETQNKAAEADKKFEAENKDKVIAAVKNSYLAAYPKEEGFMPVGKAFDKFFANPMWQFDIIYSTTLTVTFKGIAQWNNQKARFVFTFGMSREGFEKGDIRYGVRCEVNGQSLNTRDLNNALAVIFLK